MMENEIEKSMQHAKYAGTMSGLIEVNIQHELPKLAFVAVKTGFVPTIVVLAP